MTYMEIIMIPMLPMRSATVWDHAGTLLQLCSLVVKIADRRGPEKSSILRTTVMFLFLDNRNGNQRTEIFRNTLKPKLFKLGFHQRSFVKGSGRNAPDSSLLPSDFTLDAPLVPPLIYK